MNATSQLLVSDSELLDRLAMMFEWKRGALSATSDLLISTFLGLPDLVRKLKSFISGLNTWIIDRG